MQNLERLKLELNNKNYFGNRSDLMYEQILDENNLDAFEEYNKANDRVNMLESVYAILQMLANDIENFQRVETEFATTSAAYQYLQKRLADVRDEIDRVKLDTGYTDENGNVSSLVSHMFFNS